MKDLYGKEHWTIKVWNLVKAIIVIIGLLVILIPFLIVFQCVVENIGV